MIGDTIGAWVDTGRWPDEQTRVHFGTGRTAALVGQAQPRFYSSSSSHEWRAWPSPYGGPQGAQHGLAISLEEAKAKADAALNVAIDPIVDRLDRIIEILNGGGR